MIFFYYS